MKKQLYFLIFIGAFAVLGLFTAFTSEEQSPEVTIQQLMDTEVERRVEQYRQIRLKRCRQQIMDRASELADSSIMLRIRDLQIDSVPRPDRTLRPEKPETLSPLDTNPVAPLLPIDSIPKEQ